MDTLTVLGVNAPGLSQEQFLENLRSQEIGQVHGEEPRSSVIKELLILIFRRVPAPEEGINPCNYGFMLMKKCDQPWYSLVDCGRARVMVDLETVHPLGSDHVVAVTGKKIGTVNFAASGSLEEPITAQKKKTYF
jgi:hypothetical protein